MPQDDLETVDWFRKAADVGNASAQDMMGIMYENGWGVPQDYVQAHMWFNLASAQNDVAIGADRDRDRVADKMNPAQIKEAQALAAAWKPKTGN